MEFRSITSAQDETLVLHQLSLNLPPGRSTVVMGPSGCGKTTLIRHLVGLTQPRSGAILVNGTDLLHCSRDERRAFRQQMSAIVGGATLFEHSVFASLTVYDNIRYRLRQAGLSEAEIADRAMPLIHRFGLGDCLNRQPGDLSARTKRRAALAGALASPAPLLVIDDVDVCLDSLYTRPVLEAIRARSQQSRATLLVTTHEIDVARQLGDELAILSHGRITSHGPPSELLAGVETGAEFDRRFHLLDVADPLHTSMPPAPEPRTPRMITVDPQMLWWFAIAVIIGILLLALIRLDLLVSR